MKRIILSLLVALSLGSPGFAQPLTGDEQIMHTLNRLTFGPRPGDLESVKRLGLENFIQQQLHPENIAEPDDVVALLHQSPAFSKTPLQLFISYGGPAIKQIRQESMGADGKLDEEKFKSARKQLYNELYEDVPKIKVLRGLESMRQLNEVMTDFWFNHFNICVNKGIDRIWIGSYEEQAIRPYVLGKFRDLLGATCHHAGMLFYLDNWQNNAGGAKASGKDKSDGSNENYARELMELHTLGVDGGYTQKDVTELARVLTGLGYSRPQRVGGRGRRGFGNNVIAAAFQGAQGPMGMTEVNVSREAERLGFVFNESRHDYGEKVVMGHVFKGTGEAEIEEALDFLSRHPSTAHHIAYQLAQYFVADEPPPALVDRLAKRFTDTDGDIREVMNTLIHSPEFSDSKYSEAKYKNPFRFAISTLRAVNAKPNTVQPVLAFLRLQGMPLYACLTPDGYKNTESAWLNSDALLRRINFASALSSGRMPALTNGPVDYQNVYQAVYGLVSQPTLQTVTKSPENLKCALLLGSPDFMKY
jgi:uncharacterized protein (DUF1800 family)